MSSFVPGAGPGLLALAVALALVLLTRRREHWRPMAAAAAVLAGWALAAPRPGFWLAPGGVADALVLPAGVVLAAALLATRTTARRQRWLATMATWVGAWWLAGLPAARGEFWRVLFATVAAGWVLRRLRAAESPRAATMALVLLGGVLAMGSPGVATPAVVFAAALGVGLAGVGAGVGAPVPPALLAFALVATDLVAGRATQGQVGRVDVACGLALAAPLAFGMLEPAARRRLGRAAPFVAAPGVAAAMVGLAWVVARVIR